MNNRAKAWLMLAIVVAVALLAAFWAITYEPVTFPLDPRRFPLDRARGDLELFYTVKTVISSINVTLIMILLATYLSLYKKTQSEFTLGLIVFSMVLLLYALASNPIVQVLFGYRAFGLGPFAMLPDLFSSIALSVLLYLTLKY